ncbi:MAG: hypothetical protein KAQ84_01165 [Thermoplasmatales archaeon]|nr:hypothetical protein [Thermoplasmatales archaeon]
MRKYKAFLSCCIRSEDERIVDIFEYVLRAHQFDVITVGRTIFAPRPSSETIRNELEDSDCIFVLATRRVKKGEYWKTSEWVEYIEPAMAYMGRKPMLAFVERDVVVDKLIPQATQIFTFDIKNPLKDKERIDKYVNSLKSELLEIERQKQMKIQIELQRKSDEEFWNNVKIVLGILGGIGAGVAATYLLTKKKK